MPRLSLDSPYLSPGGLIIVSVAVVATLLVLVLPMPTRQGLEFWTFARNHSVMYEPLVARRNAALPADGQDRRINLFVIDGQALQRRALSGFWAGTPLADLIEVEANMFSKFVSGPLEDVGFVDLTDRLAEEGIDQIINPPSFSPWTSRGRVFGLPHDVHPVLLSYRADVFEEAGVDVGAIATWDDFARAVRPLRRDLDGDGRFDVWPINYWYTNSGLTQTLLLQAGGGVFDTDDKLIIDEPVNAQVLARLVAWCVGPDRIAVDAAEFSASGNAMRLEGRVLANIMPDWLAGVYKQYMPGLSGKLKLMPLPAWTPGGRRTSVQGGTMLGIAQRSERFDEAWAFAKDLYLSEEVARELFTTSNIISPITSYWDRGFYHAPDPFFSGQASGTAFIAQAPDVPRRTSSPFVTIAMGQVMEALNELRRFAEQRNTTDPAVLVPKAQELLTAARAKVEHTMSRNVFLAEQAEGHR